MNTGSDTDRETNLDRVLSELPVAIEPERDLWPAIKQTITGDRQHGDRHRRHPWLARLAIAASLVVVSSLATSWWLGREDNDLAVPMARQSFAELVGPVILPASYDAALVPGARYLQDRMELVQPLGDRIELLPDETREKVAGDLHEIHRALEDISKELTGDPGNVLLQQLLLAMYQNELVMLDELNQMTVAVKAQRTEL